jgi:hypothetical protein
MSIQSVIEQQIIEDTAFREAGRRALRNCAATNKRISKLSEKRPASGGPPREGRRFCGTSLLFGGMFVNAFGGGAGSDPKYTQGGGINQPGSTFDPNTVQGSSVGVDTLFFDVCGE